MKNLLSLIIVFSAPILFAHPHDRVGSAHHAGVGKAYHNGDYIDFSIDFEANCYEHQNSAWNQVSNNVTLFLEWLDAFAENYDQANVSYHVDLLSVWQKDSGYGSENDLCAGRYEGSQDLTVRIAKLDGQHDLSDDIVQDFFNSLQVAIAPYNYATNSEEWAYVQTEVDRAYKGVFEDTADMLRIAAKANAKEKATKDFFAFLGEDYDGWWYLQRVDFSNDRHDYYRTGASMEIQSSAPSMGNPDMGPVREPSILKLKPLSVSLEGNFLFHYKIEKNYFPEN